MKETPEQKRLRILNLAKASTSTAYSGTEHSIIQAIASYNELEKTRNLIHEKLEEWYGIFFPELRIQNPITYAKYIIEFGQDKKAPSQEKLAALVGDAAARISELATGSIGREPSQEEFRMLTELAKLELSVAEAETTLDKYLEESTKKLMPNITYLIDYKVAAELLGKAGSLTKLAFMPAGTIQLLGAEKALFKHIKFGTKPPKYGSIFKLQQVGGAGRFDRGRIARAYATKIAIAARADGISKNFIADKLKEQLDQVIQKQGHREHPGPQRPQKPENQQRRQGFNRFQRQQGRPYNRRPRDRDDDRRR